MRSSRPSRARLGGWRSSSASARRKQVDRVLVGVGALRHRCRALVELDRLRVQSGALVVRGDAPADRIERVGVERLQGLGDAAVQEAALRRADLGVGDLAQLVVGEVVAGWRRSPARCAGATARPARGPPRPRWSWPASRSRSSPKPRPMAAASRPARAPAARAAPAGLDHRLHLGGQLDLDRVGSLLRRRRRRRPARPAPSRPRRADSPRSRGTGAGRRARPARGGRRARPASRSPPRRAARARSRSPGPCLPRRWRSSASQRVLAGDLLVPRRAHHQHPGVRVEAEEVVQPLDRLPVAPLQVVHQEHQRLAARRAPRAPGPRRSAGAGRTRSSARAAAGRGARRAARAGRARPPVSHIGSSRASARPQQPRCAASRSPARATAAPRWHRSASRRRSRPGGAPRSGAPRASRDLPMPGSPVISAKPGVAGARCARNASSSALPLAARGRSAAGRRRAAGSRRGGGRLGSSRRSAWWARWSSAPGSTPSSRRRVAAWSR